MTAHMNKLRWILCLMILTLASCLLTGCGTEKSTEITSLEQLNEPGRKIGVSNDTNDDLLVAEKFPKAEIEYYQDAIPGYLSVSQGKLDAFVYGKLTMGNAIRNGMQGVRLLDETMGANYTMAAAIAPNSAIPDLEDKINIFLGEIKEDGTLDDMIDRWIVRKDETMPEIPAAPANSDIHLVVGTSGIYEPFTYYVGTELRGYDVELAYRFAAWLGATVEFKVYDYGGIIAAAQSGDVDCIFAALFITPERQETIRFSQPTYVEEIAVMVRDTSTAALAAAGPEYSEFADLSGKRVSMLTGAPFEELVRSKVPDVGEFTFFNNTPDMIQALKSDKTDAFLLNNAVAALAVNRNPEIAFFPQDLETGVFGMAFAKGDPRRDDWQAACDSISEETKKALWEKWTGSDDSVKILPEQDWPGSNGTVQAAVCDTLEPMSYVGDGGQLMGFDLEMILLMAKELDVHVEFTGMEFSAIMSSVQAGKAVLGAGSIIATEERKQSVDFVEYYPAAFVLVVRSMQTGEGQAGNDAADGGSFLSRIADSFEKTFIRESRWILFVQGIGTTLLITVLSILFGTALGFGVFMLCRNGNPVANTITRFSVWLVQGMPVVVLLMILYYIVFSKVSVSGSVVSVVGFTLIFGSAMYGMLKSGVGAIDRGQTEAAYALGYTDRKAFFRVVLPQALPHFMPAYKGEITALIKATAVVGYITVQDLTKMGDIIRSRTYDAFFPLISVAVIYFILAAILIFIVNKIEIRIDPRRRSRESILKGVNVK